MTPKQYEYIINSNLEDGTTFQDTLMRAATVYGRSLLSRGLGLSASYFHNVEKQGNQIPRAVEERLLGYLGLELKEKVLLNGDNRRSIQKTERLLNVMGLTLKLWVEVDET